MHYRRSQIEGATYFFTINLADRTSSLLLQKVSCLYKAIQLTKINYSFEIIAYVILPEHLHLIISLPENDKNYSLRLSMIKSLFSRQIPPLKPTKAVRKFKREREIWQKRFWEHLIQDDKDLEQHVNYIHFNPVKHGYVQKASDWVHSSIHKYIKIEILTPNWGWCETLESTKQFGE